MDTRTGEIVAQEFVDALKPDERKFYIPVTTRLTPRQMETRKVGRNDPCPCGSGKKFKRCHLQKEQK